MRAIIKDPAKAGLIVSLFALWFLSFGHLAGQIAVLTEGIYNRSLFFATALLVGLGGFLIVRSRRTFGGLTRVLNAVAVTLVVFNVSSDGPDARPPASRRARQGGQGLRPAAARPNIYYIVLDAYTRADILKEVFSFDNSAFLAGLEERGFVVADRSYANYNLTQQSLASSLNFTLLDSVAKDVGAVSFDREPLYAMIRENRAMAFLKTQGYRLITASSSIEPTDFKRADRYFGFAQSDSEFRGVLLDTTPLPAFRIGPESRFLRRPPGKDPQRLPGPRGIAHGEGAVLHVRPYHGAPSSVRVRSGRRAGRARLSLLHGRRRPAPRGEPGGLARLYRAVTGPSWPFSTRRSWRPSTRSWRDLAEPPVIVLQGDHGSRTYTDLDRPEASYFKENLAILNAYHLPGDGGPSSIRRYRP